MAIHFALPALAALGRAAAGGATGFSRIARIGWRVRLLTGGNDEEEQLLAAKRIAMDVVRSIRVTVDNRASLRHLDNVQRRKIPLCAAIALTRTAKELQKLLEAEVRRVFHRPTQWVARGTFTRPATKSNLTAVVGFKDKQSLYVKEHVTGGRRNQKPFERALSGLGVLPSGFKAIPGGGMKLDGNGNPNRAQLKEVLGALRSGIGRYGKRGKNVYHVGYFVVQEGNPSSLPAGIWRRINNRAISPVFLFVSAAAYEKRLDLKALAAKHAQPIFNREFERAWAQYR